MERETKSPILVLGAGGMNQLVGQTSQDPSLWTGAGIDATRPGENRRGPGKSLTDNLGAQIMGLFQFWSPFGYLVSLQQLLGSVTGTTIEFTDTTIDYTIPTGSQPLYSDVILLCHLNSVDVALVNGRYAWKETKANRTTETNPEFTTTASANTSIFKFGGASANKSAIEWLTNDNTFYQGQWGAWTAEMWINILSFDDPYLIGTFGSYYGSDIEYFGSDMYFNGTNIYWFTNLNGVDTQESAPHGMVTGQWYHICVLRDGNNIKFYVNGVLKLTSANGLATIAGVNYSSFYLGTGDVIYGTGLKIYRDEVRLSKSVFYNTAGFTPPTEQFPDS